MDRILEILIRIIIFFSGFARPLARIGIGDYREWTPGEKIRLLLVGYNGARNTGADARVVAAVKQIKRIFGADRVGISVITLSEEMMAGYFDEDVKLLKISSIYLKDLYRACSSHHAAVLCEGSTLKSTFANALSLFFCEASGIMERQGKPCIAFGSEVGAMDPSLRKTAAATCRGTYFMTRTEESQKILTELGLRGHVGTDTAWLYDDEIPPEEADRLLAKAGWDGKQDLLGIAVIDPFCWPVRASVRKWIRGGITGNREGRYDRWYFYSDSPRRREAFRRYIDAVAEAVRPFLREHDCFPVLLGMERMDVKACNALEEKLDAPCAVFLSGENSADIMSGVIGRLSALVTSRYHAAVLSMKQGCPIVAVSMDERLDSLMREVSLEEKYLQHVTDEDLGRRIHDSLEEGFSRREELREHIRGCYSEYQRKQEEMGAFLKEYILEGLGGARR